MKSSFFVLIGMFLFFRPTVNGQVYCNVSVTKEKVGFGGCYSGALTINQLQVLDSSIREYPLKFKKTNAIKLIEKSPIPNDGKKVEVYFNEKNKHFKWRVYAEIVGHHNDDMYSDFPHVDKKIIGNVFKADTWYLFNFYNPHFRVFVYSNSSCNITFVKEKLSSNF